MTTWKRLAVPFVLVAFVASTIPRGARAQGTPAASAADDAKRQGDDAMVALRYEEALGHYRRAYEASKNPAILYNMGRAYEGLGDFPKALDALEEFADKAPADLKARVPKLGELLADVRNRVSTLVVSSAVDGAEIRLGERVVGKTKPGQVVLRVNAGNQHLTIAREGYFPFEKDVALAGGRVETVDAVLASRTESAVLRVTSPVTGAAVAIDGRSVGVVPAESLVAPGSHKILLRRDGYDPTDTNVVVAAGEKKSVDLPMTARETITQKWWFWTAIGVVVVAGGVVTYIAATTEREADKGTIDPGRVKAESFGVRF
jgi:hypothetical protein